jgi:hypothetical protein
MDAVVGCYMCAQMDKRQTRVSRLIFAAKAFALRVRRLIRDLGERTRRWPSVNTPMLGMRFEVRSSLFVDGREEERAYELGKVANLRAAVRHLDGVEIPAGEVFSFWSQVGRATSWRGFTRGRMLQSGCVVPSVGGGLCQLSNALYELALSTGCEIVERHPHSVRLPGMPLRDATVAWNYIDLRFRAKGNIRMEWTLTDSELVGAFICANPAAATLPVLGPHAFEDVAPSVVETCATCAEIDCTRHERTYSTRAKTQAFLLDAYWPEFDRYVQKTRREGDCLMSPINGAFWRLPQYAWSREGFVLVGTQPLRTLERSLRLRRLGPQGAARQKEMLRASAAMGLAMATRLPSLVAHVVVDQSMLAALWRSGELGGRSFDVVMRRLPMRVLQARLDDVARRWPESRTASDFRVGSDLLDAEDEALQSASRIVTPHREIAGMFEDRSVLLDWIVPNNAPFARQTDRALPRIYFPGPVAARKGAYALREALEGLDVELIWGGSELEGERFWEGIKNRKGLEPGAGIAAVVQPAFLEDRPRALLQAIAAGVPAIATAACGLGGSMGVEIVGMGDIADLRRALERMLVSSAV